MPKSMKRRATKRATKRTKPAKRSMRGGMVMSPAELTDVTMKTATTASMKQGGDFFGYHKAQHGGMAPVGYTGVLDDALRASARIATLDSSLGEIRGMKDQAGGGFKLPMKVPMKVPFKMPAGLPALPAGFPAMPKGLPALPAGLPAMPALPMMPQANANAAVANAAVANAAATNAAVANAVANVAVANAAVANANAAAASGAAYGNNAFGGRRGNIRRGNTRARRGNRRDRKTRRMMYGGGALGFMDVKAPGMLLDGALAKQALNTMNAEWKLAEHASSFAPKQL